MTTIARKQPRQLEAIDLRPLRAVVVSDAITGRNGVGTYYQDLVQQLQGRVEHLSLIAPSSMGKSPHVRFAIPMPGDSTQFLAYPKKRLLEQRILECSPNVVILPTLGPYAYFGSRIAEKHKIPVCVAHHTNLEALVELYWHPLLAGVACGVLKRLSNWLIQRADTVVTMDVESLEQARTRGAKRVRQMGTPLSTSFLHQPRRPLSLDPPRIVFLGRLSAEKGVDQVIDAARLLPRFTFRIGGDGPLKRRVQREAGRLKNLSYLGWLHRDEVLQAMDDADILVLPSKLETFGTVALEALARRRLVLVSRGCGIAHWPDLAQGLFAIQEDESLAAALKRIARMSPRLRDSIARRGWEAVEQFNEATLHGWINVLADTCGRYGAFQPVMSRASH